MRKTVLLLLWFISRFSAQTDSVFLLNGIDIPVSIHDTNSTSITAVLLENRARKVVYEQDELFKVVFANGFTRYYYAQDSINNWLSRDEVVYYRKGEQDARHLYTANGAFIGGMLTGIAAGMTGSFWSPIAPFTFMALTGIPKIRIRKNNVRDTSCLNQESYVLGYERVARQRQKLKALFGGTVGLILGFAAYASFNPYYPESLKIGSGNH